VSGSSQNPLKVSIVTPCRNAEHLVARTVESIVGQSAVRSGRVELEYLLIDGASTDRTVEVARAAGGSRVSVRSEPDRGMYDALAKGLRAATGDVVAYLNAGDAYSLGAFEVLADLFERPEVAWLTGFRIQCNERGAVVGAYLPVPYRRRLLAKGAHDGVRLEFVQQESTFWRRSLHAQLDLVPARALPVLRAPHGGRARAGILGPVGEAAPAGGEEGPRTRPPLPLQLRGAGLGLIGR